MAGFPHSAHIRISLLFRAYSYVHVQGVQSLGSSNSSVLCTNGLPQGLSAGGGGGGGSSG